MRTTAWFVILATALIAPTLASGQTEPTQFICAVWPDRILYYDQTTDAFDGGFTTRHGGIRRGRLTSDRRRLFVITDRMESVEVIDPLERKVVDSFKLSGANRQVRFHDVIPNQDGSQVYLSASIVNRGVDRFEREESGDIIAYDVVEHAVIRQFSLPPEVATRAGGPARLHVAPDDKSFYVIGRDIYQVDAETLEVIDTLKLSEPLMSGYGPYRGLSLTETEPGIFFGIYRTTDPAQGKSVFGVARLDLYGKDVSTFELGPEARVGRLALSPDGKRGYAGLHDIVVVDMEQKTVLLKKEGFEQGRTNTSMIVSHDGTKLYVSGVGDSMYIYDATTLELIKTVFAGGDFMMPPVEIPSR